MKHFVMVMDSRVKFCSPQNVSVASQQISVTAFSKTTEVAVDLNCKKTTEQNPHMAPFSSFIVMQNS